MKPKFRVLCDYKVGAMACYFKVMEAADLVMLLVTILVLRFPNAILVSADPSDVDLIVSFFED